MVRRRWSVPEDNYNVVNAVRANAGGALFEECIMTRILGIDPGLAGAMCVIDVVDGVVGQPIAVLDLPTIGDGAKRRIDARAVSDWIQRYQPQIAYLELAGVMPRQGISSGFRYGRAVGSLETTLTLAEISTVVVAPAKWKAFFGLVGSDKENDRLKALQLFPSAHELLALKKHHQRADALLLALYGAKHAQV
jgi:crossover junction endodeoxyribonuclease RuvC